MTCPLKACLGNGSVFDLDSYPGNPRAFAEKDVLGLTLQEVSEGTPKAEGGLENDFVAVGIQDTCDDTVVRLQKTSERMMIFFGMLHGELYLPGCSGALNARMTVGG